MYASLFWNVGTTTPSATSAKPQTMCVTPTGTFSQPSTSLCQNTTVRSAGVIVGHDDGRVPPVVVLLLLVLLADVVPLAGVDAAVLGSTGASELLRPAFTVTATAVMIAPSTSTGNGTTTHHMRSVLIGY